MVNVNNELTAIEDLFLGKGNQQVAPNIIESLGKIISQNLNSNKEIEVDYYNLYKSEEIEFEKWLYSKFSKNYARNVINTSRKMFLLSTKSLKDISILIKEEYVNKKSGTVSFRVFLNYLEEKELLDELSILKARKKVKIINFQGNMDIYVPTTKEIKTSLNILNSGEYPRETLFIYKFMLESGCRYTEVEYFLKNFDEKNVSYKENIVSYKNFYLRGKKSSFFLFSSKETFENLKSIIGVDISVLKYVKRKIHRNDDIVCLKYLRKYNFTKLIQSGIDFELSNFIQGRTSKNIGVNHYLAKETIILPKYISFVNSLTKKLY